MTASLSRGALWVCADKVLSQPLFGQARLKLIKKLLQPHRVSDKTKFGGRQASADLLNLITRSG